MTLRAVLAAALVLAAAPPAARAGDPLRDHFTIESEHFVVHSYRPLEPIARRVAVVAEWSHATLAPALDHAPREKTIIVVVDDTDSANGFASVLPRNAITIFVTAPPSFSELDDHEDWLLGLVAHEYTHVLHLDTMSGLPNIYNRVFGKTWAPNQVMPRWIIEGIATYEESKRTAGGRNRGSRFDQVIRIARHEDKDLRLDQVSGAPRQFPRGNAAYVYGSHFLRYIFDRFGDDTLRQMSHKSGEHPIPFAINRQIAKVVGQPFTTLYDDWKSYLRDRYGQQEMAAERRGLVTGRPLTRTGEGNVFPQYSLDGRRVMWLQNDGYHRTMLRELPTGGAPADARDVMSVDAWGPFDVLADGSIIFEGGGRLYRREYAWQDLYRWDARTRQTTKLTHGMRARDPAVSPDGRRIAFSKNEASTSVLGIVDAVPGSELTVAWRGQRYEQAFQPAWSPDGGRIAFSAWRKDGYRDILVVELASGRVEEITRDRAIDMNPAWSPDGQVLYFDSDRTGISNLYAYDVAARTTWQVTNVLGGAFRPAPSPDGTRLAFMSAVPRGGHDIFELHVNRATWLPARDYIDDKPTPLRVRDDAAAVSEVRPYRPLESLAPQAWTLTTQLTGDVPSASIQTSGSDAFGLHSYQLSLGLGLETGDVNVGAFYGYSRLRFPIRLSAARTVSDRGGVRIDGAPTTYRQEDWGATLSTSIPFEARPESSWTLAFDYDFDWFRVVDAADVFPDPNDRLPAVPVSDFVQTGIGTRVGYSRTRGTTFGVGPAYGFDTSLGLRFDHPALGATYKNVTISYGLNAYRQLWGKTPTLALRLGGSLRVGDLVRTGSFSLGGTPAQDVARSVLDSTRAGINGYLRGYEPRVLTGNQFHLANLEYRQELFQIERGLQTLPVYLRRVQIAGLLDVGAAADTTFSYARNVRTSVGGALRLDAYFGYFAPGTFELGYSRGLDEGGIHETWLLLTGSL